MRTICALVTGLVVAGSTATAFANDTCAAATAIPSLPFTATLDTTTATADPSDPVLSCTGLQELNSVWFTYTAERATTLEIDTLGSDYNTAVGVYTGSCAALSEIACPTTTTSTTRRSSSPPWPRARPFTSSSMAITTTAATSC
jgi:hypothetical protein